MGKTLKYLMLLFLVGIISFVGCANFSPNRNYLGLILMQSQDGSETDPMSGTVFSLEPVSQTRLGGTGNDEGTTISVDASRNVIVGASFTGDGDVNGDGDALDGGAEDATGYGGTDIIISKFDSSGVFQWAKRLGGTSADKPLGITTDTAGNIYVTGFITGNADLNGDGDSLDGGAEDGAAYGGTDVFLVKFSSAGTFQWAKRMGGTGSDYSPALTLDLSENIILTGQITGDVDINGDGDALDGGSDAFVSGFDSSGKFLKAIRLGGVGTDLGLGIITDSTGNILVTGKVTGDADLNGDGDALDGGAENSTGYGGTDVFIAIFGS